LQSAFFLNETLDALQILEVKALVNAYSFNRAAPEDNSSMFIELLAGDAYNEGEWLTVIISWRERVVVQWQDDLS
jgi:hypothetical protein